MILRSVASFQYVLDGPSNATRLDNESCLQTQYFHFFLVESQYSCTKVRESFSMLEFTDHKRPGSCLFFVRKWSSTNLINRFWRKTFKQALGAALITGFVAIGQEILKETTYPHTHIYVQGRPHSYQICFGCRILPLYERSMKERCMPMHYWKCERFREIIYQK